MQNRIEDTIFECVIDTIKSFLVNDMSITIDYVKDSIIHDFKDYTASISLSGKDNFIFIVFIDTKLLKSIYRVFFTQELSKEETSEMMIELPKEIINTVVGLSISNFPQEHRELELSVPLDIKRENIENLILNKYTLSKEICTEYGNFQCMLVG